MLLNVLVFCACCLMGGDKSLCLGPDDEPTPASDEAFTNWLDDEEGSTVIVLEGEDEETIPKDPNCKDINAN